MSRFWAAQDSSSDSGSDSSDDSSVSDSSVEEQRKTADRWLDISDSDDSSDEERVAKSAKERLFETLQSHVSKIRVAMKSRDFLTILSSYQSLHQISKTSKSKAILNANGGVPRFLIKLFCQLEDYIAERKKDKAAQKKLSPSNGRALNRLGNNMRKDNKDYAKLMKEYRANPDAVDDDDDDEEEDVDVAAKSDSDSSSSSSSDSDSDSDSDSSKSSKSSSSSSDSDSDSDDDDDDAKDDDESENWDDSSSSSSSSEEDTPEGDTELKGRSRWLKRVVVTTKRVQKPKGGPKKDATKDEEEKKETEEAKVEVKEEELTAAVLMRKCNDLVSSRGRRGTDTKSVLKKLERLSELAIKYGPRIEVPILMHVVTAQFDLIRSLDDYMETTSWKACMEQLNRVAGILEDGEDDSKKYELCTASVEDDDLMIGNLLTGKVNKMKDAAGVGELGALDAVAADKTLINPHTGQVETEDDRAERLRVEKEESMTEEELRKIPVAGSLSLFVNRLDEEYYKGLRRTNSHSIDYVHHLRDETKLVALISQVRQYFIRVDSKPEASELSLLKVEHLYYCHDNIAQQLAILGTEFDSVEILSDLCTYVYQYGTDRSKTRAMMCQIYHHALHDRFLEARDLLLMSHLQDNISNVGDVSTMILFNRMMVNLGLSAFRLGKIWDAHQCLSDICSGRVRELLAQGVSTGRYAGDKTVEEEKAEKRRQIPFHLHINVDLLEACHLISAMLLEVPNIAANSGKVGRKSRTLSRQFRKHFDSFNRQVFAGPPEQTRDYIMCATKALMNGDWKKCVDYLSGLETWQLLPGDNVSEQINKMIEEKVKVEGLRTYLFKFSAHYDSLSLEQLCGMFELSKNEVHSIVSKMMFNGDLHANWENETIVLKKIEPSNLQVLALQFAEKAANLVESNERLLDTKSGRHAFRDDGHHHRGDHQRGHGSRSQGGRGGRGYQRGGRGGGRGYKSGGGRGYNNNNNGGRRTR